MAPREDNEADWRLECGDLEQRAEHVLQNGLWTDCTFLVGLGPDKVEFKAHKLLLAMASPVFEAMFYGPLAEENGPITIPDISPDTFRTLLHYIYTSHICMEMIPTSHACDVFYAAQKYLLTHLMEACMSNLSYSVVPIPSTAAKTYEFAKFIGLKVLEEKSLKVMATHTKAVLNDSSFEELEIETVLKLFSLDRLDIDSELDLYAAAERYTEALETRSGDEASKADHDKNPHDSESEDIKQALSEDETKNETDQSLDVLACQASASRTFSNKRRRQEETVKVKGNKRALIRDLYCQIRFLTLTADQFAAYKTLTSLLSQAEIMSLLTNIMSSEIHVPMPSGFSTRRDHRTTKVPGLIAKSFLVLNVEPQGDKTDMAKAVRGISREGLLWGNNSSDFQFSCVLEDDKVSVDWLTEEIEKLKEVQSTDIVVFNRI